MDDNNQQNIPIKDPIQQTHSIIDSADYTQTQMMDSFVPQAEDPNITALQQTIMSIPQEANDTDLIEKEWVEMLEQIVARTSEDPYTQQAEISKIKAVYMKKRYNRDIKRGE